MLKNKNIFIKILVLLFIGGQSFLFAQDQAQDQAVQKIDMAEKERQMEILLQKGLKSFRDVPYDDAYRLIEEKMQKSKGAPIYRKIPKSYAFVTNFLRDEEAPQKFFSILKDKNRLYTFAGCSLTLIILSWLIKRQRRKTKSGFFEAFAKGTGHFLFFTSLKIALIYMFFRGELKPLWRVIQETYL